MIQPILRTLFATVLMCVPAAGSALAVVSPRDFQVFQRDAHNSSRVLISGITEEPVQAAEYRVNAGSWQPMTSIKGGQGFAAFAPLRPGGWYAIEVRIVGQTDVVRVEHVGVGEVFVIAGQSNATNYGSEKQKTTSGMVSTFDGKNWRLADDPQPGVQDHSAGGSFIPAFGDALAAKLHMPIGIACVGAGATSVREWLPRGSRMANQPTTGKHVTSVGPHEWESDGVLYSGLIERLVMLDPSRRPNGFRAILWHQGESDTGQARAGYPADRQITGKEYHDWLKQIIEQSQKDIGWKIPWFVAQATYHSEQDPADEEFRAAQKQLWTEGIAQEGPDTDQLRAEFRHGVHFNAKGLTRHGQLWAEKVEQYLAQ